MRPEHQPDTELHGCSRHQDLTGRFYAEPGRVEPRQWPEGRSHWRICRAAGVSGRAVSVYTELFLRPEPPTPSLGVHMAF